MFSQWAITMLAAFVGLSSLVAILYQIQYPWNLLHFAALKPLMSNFELILGLLPLTFCAALNAIAVMCLTNSQKPLLILAIVIGAAGGLGWAALFTANLFFSWTHLWLPLVLPAYPTMTYMLLTEMYESREQIRKVEKLVFEHDSA